MLISGINFEDSVLMAFVDVTKRKKAEEALQRKRALLDTITSATDVMLVYLDRDFKFVVVNPAYAATCRMRPEEMLGRNHFELYPNPENEAIFRRVRESGEAVFYKDKPFTFPDQPERGITYWDWSLVPVKNADGYVVGLVFSLRETTRYKQMELDLRESESRHRALFERIEQGVVYQDAAGRITDANPAAVRLLGLTMDQLLGRTSLDGCWEAIREDGSPFPGDEHPAMLALRTGKPVPEVVMGIRSGKDPACRWILVDAVPEFRSGEAHPYQVFTSFTDITHRRQMEEQRLRLERHMQETRRLESLGVLAGGIAHDFNNLLTAILGHTELMLGDLPPTSSARTDLEAIKQACGRAAELCRQMLAYSGQGRFMMEPLLLTKLADEVVGMLYPALPAQTRIERQWTGESPRFRGDANQIRQIVQSLVHNASEAIGDHAGVVRLSAGSMHCSPQSLGEDWRYDSLVEGEYVWLEVADTGCGMNAETSERVFEPFFTTKFTGRGLGLPAVLGIVKGHRGAIRIQSAPGKGTIVRVVFPAITAS